MRVRWNFGVLLCFKIKGFKDFIVNVLVLDFIFYYCWGSGGDDGNDVYKFEFIL